MTSDGPWTAFRPPDRFALAPPRSLPPDLAIVSLEPWHAVIALGTDGGQPLADGDELARGVHLLWTLRPELGFPAEGYDVYRRRHRPPEWGCLDPPNGLLPPKGRTQWEFLDTQLAVEGDGVRLDADACPPTGAAHVVGQGSLTVMEPRRRAAVRAVGQGDPPLVEVLADTGDGRQVIASAPADAREGGGWSAEVWAQGIVGCRLSGEDMRICVVCFGDADETGGWQKLNEQPVLTPVVTPGTANEPANLHGPDATRAEARGRLSASLPRAAKDALSAGFADVGELVEDALRDGRGALLPAAATDTTGARTPPRLALATLGAVAVTAVDPDVARMLGLYWHDPVDDGRFDYKVVARHGAVRFPGPVIAFGELAPGAAGSTLDVDGVHFVGTAGLEIVASGRTRALRVPAPVIGTAAGLRLDRTVPAITLQVADATGTAFTAWRGSQRVASAVAFIGRVALEDPGGIDAVTWSVGPLDLLEVELHPRAGLVGDLPAYAWRLSPTRPDPVHGLDLTEVASAVEPTRLRPDGTLDDATGVVGLDWRATSAASDPGRPVRVHVGRADPGAEPEVRNADRPAAAFARSPGNARPGPDVPRRWIEHGLAAGSYGWSVRGIDVFGRLGDWSEERMVAVGAGVVPPPPDAVTAAYLDPADPSLPDEHRALAERDGPGLLVEWTWPAGHRIAAPGVDEFRVYARRDDPNALAGAVLSVTDRGDRSRLRTDRAVPGGRDDLAGERLRVGGASFAILGNDGAQIEVAHLTSPTERPTTGPFAIDLSPTCPLHTDLAVPRGFGPPIHVEPAGALPRVTARVTAVAADSVTLADPLPPGDLVPGLLASGGIAYTVVEQHSATVTVRGAAQPDGSVALPAVGADATLWPGARYRAWLPGQGARPHDDERWAMTLVAVSACDVDAVVPPEPVPPHLPRRAAARRGGTGLEGPLSRVARVVVPHRDAPGAVVVALPDGDIPADRAEPADWYGRAAYRLGFAPVPGATEYRVLRASVASLFEADRAARRDGLPPYAGGAADVDYAELSNREVMALAELACNEPAFLPAGTVAAPPFDDTLDGRGLGRFVYRVRSVDASGNAGPWSAAFPLVETRDVTAPAVPTLTSVLGGENRITTQWSAGTEPDLAEYRIWRADSREALDDVRRLEPTATVPADTHRFDDEGLPGLRTFYYRVAAVDAAGNVSPATPATAARVVDTTPPAPPAWVAAERTARGVRLAWRATEAGLTCVLQRRPLGGGVWRDVSGALEPDDPPDGFAHLDRTRRRGRGVRVPGAGAATPLAT